MLHVFIHHTSYIDNNNTDNDNTLRKYYVEATGKAFFYNIFYLSSSLSVYSLFECQMYRM